jgi:phenylalanine ammonia-lyase
MGELLKNNITPLVPLRSSISASGGKDTRSSSLSRIKLKLPCLDLSPLSYIAGTLVGNPSIRVFDGPCVFGARRIVPSQKALADHNIEPIPLKSKEHLGILNGTAFSASVAALALNDAVHLALLAQVCTAMGTEALIGTRGSFDAFIHKVARPHPGQVSCVSLFVICLILMNKCQKKKNRLKPPKTSGTCWKAVRSPAPTKMKSVSKTTKGRFARIATHCELQRNSSVLK